MILRQIILECGNFLKLELIGSVLKHRSCHNTNVVDEIAKLQKHVHCLLPYHCDPSPPGHTQVEIKMHAELNNRTFKLKGIKVWKKGKGRYHKRSRHLVFSMY
jgi:hypothetical protein